MTEFLAGYAEVDYTPEPGQALRGQQFTRIAEYTHDPLMANAAAYRCGEEIAVIVSIDQCFYEIEHVTQTQRKFEERTGLPGSKLLVHATHSHVAPVTTTSHWGEVDPAFLERLSDAIVEAAATAITRLAPATPFSGSGELEHLGWNRRVMFADGTSKMHGDCRRPDFTGIEGPRDPILSVLFTRDAEGRINGVITSFSIHPNSVECGCYYSADIPGEVRRRVKQLLGDDVVVVYLTSAAGNTTPIIRHPYTAEQPWMGEEGLWRSGLYLAGETAKVIASAINPIDPIGFKHEHTALKIPMRPFPAPGDINYPDFWSEESREYYHQLAAVWPEHMKQKSPMEVRINVFRIGDTVICTNPAELFVEFGLKIREASPARVTILSELTDGYIGYIPTPLAFSRGGYETWTAPTSQLIPEAGDKIVQATAELLDKVF